MISILLILKQEIKLIIILTEYFKLDSGKDNDGFKKEIKISSIPKENDNIEIDCMIIKGE